jgi:DNA repair exonuclease SbcCD nuclease subunit
MVKIAMPTDTHAGVRNDNPAFHKYQQKCWDWFFDYIDTNNIKHVIHLGDIYDRRKYVNFMSAKRLREDFLNPLEERGIETHIIQGNHDSYYKDTHEVNALDELVAGRYRHIHTHSVPGIINIDGLDIQIMPWITDSNYKESMEAIKHPKAPILMGHLELNGFTMHRGLISDHGLDRKLFENFDAVYSGHYHHRSSIGNIHYIGAFGEYTWHDYSDPRGFSILDTTSRQIEFIQNPHKMFRMAKYDDVANPEIIEKIQKTDFSKYKDCYVKLVVLNKSNPYAFDLLFDSIYKAGPLDIQVVEDATILLDNEDADEIDEAEDTVSILSKYIDGLKLPLDNGKMKNFMIDIYNESLQVETV